MGASRTQSWAGIMARLAESLSTSRLSAGESGVKLPAGMTWKP